MADYLSRVRSALAAREGALAAWRHSPNGSNGEALARAHKALDQALESLWAVMTPAERVAVDARAVKVLVQV